MKNENKKPRSWQRTALITLGSVLAVILVLLIAGVIWLTVLMNQVNYVDPDAAAHTMSPEQLEAYLNQTDAYDPNLQVVDPSDVTWDTSPDVLPKQGDNIVNILLIGQDARYDHTVKLSDAMILCTVNKSAKTLTFTSFMRDMYVQIPGHISHRLNSSYAWGGMQLLDQTLNKNFGVEIDGNVEVSFSGFMKVIDMIGGIDIELTAAEAKYLNKNGNWDYEPDSAGTWNLKEGVNHLTASQALAYSRIRYVGNSDYERTSRQRTVLKVLMEEIKKLNLTQLNSMLSTVLPMVTTDMTQSEIIGYVVDIFPLLSDLTVNTMRIPADGTFSDAYISGMAVLQPNLEKNRKLLAEIMK